jgi:hypothetical protein
MAIAPIAVLFFESYNGDAMEVSRHTISALGVVEGVADDATFFQRESGLHGINHFGLRITDEKAWQRTLAAENIEVLYDGPVRWPHSTSWYILDPTGWEIEVALWDKDTVAFD